MRVFEALAQELHRQGIDAAFTYLSEDIIDLTAELARHGVQVYNTRHEAAAVAMADGYARASQAVGLAIVGTGPGLANAMVPLINAAKARTFTRLLVVAGHAATGLGDPSVARTSARQSKYIDQVGTLSAAGVPSVTLESPETAVADLGAALDHIRTGATTVVNLPVDVGGAEAHIPEHPSVVLGNSLTAHQGPPSSDDVEVVADLVESGWAAQRPIIVAGRGAASPEAVNELRRLGEVTGALLGTSLQARSLFAGDPYDIGIVGTMATEPAVEVLAESDLILAFGIGLTQFTTYRGQIFPKARVVQFDSDPEAFGRYLPVDHAVLGDAAASARAVADELTRRRYRGAGYRGTVTPARVSSIGRREPPVDAGQVGALDPRVLMARIDTILPPDRTIVVDCGHHSSFTCAYLTASHPDRFYLPMEFSAVGPALGFALGVALAQPNRLTVCVIGDGGLMLTLAEVDTAVRYSVPMLILVANDSALGAEVHFLETRGYSGESAKYPNPSFAAVAEALGADGMTIESLEDVSILRNRLDALRGPLLVDCKLSTNVRAEWITLFHGPRVVAPRGTVA